MTARPTTTTTAADPLGPDSLTWKYFGERAGSLVHTMFSLAGRRPARGLRRPGRVA